MTGPVGEQRYPPIADYALLSDCHSVALVSRRAAIDWFCAPRADAPPVFSRLLDWERGGTCQVWIDHDDVSVTRRYVGRTMVLETSLVSPAGTIVVTDALTMTAGGARHPHHQLIRRVSCTDGQADVGLRVAPRFDYGSIRPWVRAHPGGRFSAVGGSSGLLVWSDLPLEIDAGHDLVARSTLRAGEVRWLSLTTRPPEQLDQVGGPSPVVEELARRLADTERWWEEWCIRRRGRGEVDAAELRSALVLRSLVHAPTGAILAAPTASLPEVPGGTWNWDYRFSWIRDSWFTVRTLADVGYLREADGFRRFIERTTAGSASELQPLYGIDGRHRLTEVELTGRDGYRGARPVRIGNAAQAQLQLDMFGYLLELSWQWAQRGTHPDEAYWRFVVEVVDEVCDRWSEPDHGIWELRGEPQHYVYSKVCCWTALDRAVRLAELLGRGDEVDLDRWRAERTQVEELVGDRGVDPARGCFTATLDGRTLDASLLLLPVVGFVDHADPRMVATVDAVVAELDDGGLIRRFPVVDPAGREGTFVACTFWLVECLAHLGRVDEAESYFQRAVAASNDLGLFAEEVHPATGELLGNFPQGLSHLAHLAAARALDAAKERA